MRHPDGANDDIAGYRGDHMKIVIRKGIFCGVGMGLFPFCVYNRDRLWRMIDDNDGEVVVGDVVLGDVVGRDVVGGGVFSEGVVGKEVVGREVTLGSRDLF